MLAEGVTVAVSVLRNTFNAVRLAVVVTVVAVATYSVYVLIAAILLWASGWIWGVPAVLGGYLVLFGPAALGAWGFGGMRRWMWPWAAAYSAQVAIGMLVWNLLDARGRGGLAGAITALIFMVPTVALWRAKRLFVG